MYRRPDSNWQPHDSRSRILPIEILLYFLIKELFRKSCPDCISPGAAIFLLSAYNFLPYFKFCRFNYFTTAFILSLVTFLFFSITLMITFTSITTIIIFTTIPFFRHKKARSFLTWPGCSFRCVTPYRSNHGRFLSLLFINAIAVNPLPAGT